MISVPIFLRNVTVVSKHTHTHMRYKSDHDKFSWYTLDYSNVGGTFFVFDGVNGMYQQNIYNSIEDVKVCNFSLSRTCPCVLNAKVVECTIFKIKTKRHKAETSTFNVKNITILK